MIEPPAQARVRRIFEIHDRIHIAIKQTIFEKLRRFVGETCEFESRVRRILALIKTAKKCG